MLAPIPTHTPLAPQLEQPHIPLHGTPALDNTRLEQASTRRRQAKPNM